MEDQAIFLSESGNTPADWLTQQREAGEAEAQTGAGGGTATPASQLQNMTDEQLQAELAKAR